MSAVSISVTPSLSAASRTARDCSRSQRAPKLFVPRPTTETSGPPSPSVRVRTARRYRLGSVLRADAATTWFRLPGAAASEETEQGQHEDDDQDDPEDAHGRATAERAAELREAGGKRERVHDR